MRLRLCNNFKTINNGAEELAESLYMFMNEIQCHRD